MLTLKGITKQYTVGDTKVDALRGVDIAFRQSEFVSILGPSGCGKTTLLNIIGGLDRYTDGDLSISGVSTKQYTDAHWDRYRNHSIGFVFQSYNLIPHQSVLANVELALTLSGVSKSERRHRAEEVLDRVGLKDHLHKRPNQLSGGQMQRVAIARALINNPEILLADEPTGALDSETSVQIMELLKEISDDKLVIMVTHNPELAEQYSTRIIRLLDGRITDDSDPFDAPPMSEPQPTKKRKREKVRSRSMSFWTALSLSTNNLLTKKGRTLMTSFAGSIGIIGIALILSLSSGFQAYIDRVQTETLSAYPLTIEQETADMTEMMVTMMEMSEGELNHDLDKIYTNDAMTQLMQAMVEERTVNDLTKFKKYLESEEKLKPYVSAIQYAYNLDLQIFKSDTEDGVVQVNPNTVMQSMMGEQQAQMMAASPMSNNANVWQELLGNQELLESQYELIEGGRWPKKYNEVVLIVDRNNEISEIALYALGLKDQDELKDMMASFMKGESFETESVSFTYDEILDLTFSLVLNTDYYDYDDTAKQWVDQSEDEAYLTDLVQNGEEIKVVGIIRPKEEAVATAMTGAIGYTHDLTEWVIERIHESDIVKQQQADETVDVFTGKPFPTDEKPTYTMADVQAYTATLPAEEQAQMAALMQTMTEEQILAMFEKQMEAAQPKTTYEQNLSMLGVVELKSPARINLYATDFESKDMIKEIIDEYNEKKTEEGKEDQVIQYTDYIGLMMSSISTIISVISYVLIAFVAISLVVSSIMIGIITYISVLERTKEIGILRAMGASKKDISRVFNAETLIVGFTAGALGILVTLGLLIPINLIIELVGGIANVAQLPVEGGIALIAVSVIFTTVAGLIPSRVAAKKDPVEALRTE